MKNFDELINNLVTKLMHEGSAEFSQDGLQIKASNDNGVLSISASYEDTKDYADELLENFQNYIENLDDEIFIEICESFNDGELKAIQDKLDSGKVELIEKGIEAFMSKVKDIVSPKLTEVEQELKRLGNLRASYIKLIND